MPDTQRPNQGGQGKEQEKKPQRPDEGGMGGDKANQGGQRSHETGNQGTRVDKK